MTIAAISVTTGMGRLSGLTFQGTLDESGPVITVKGKGRGPNGLGTLAVTLTDNSETGKGSLSADWGPVTFSGSGAQPVQILSGLKDFSKFSGGIRVQLTFGWTATSDSSQAVVTLTNAAFEHPQASVKGVNTRLTVNDLARLTTPAGQVITAELIDIGIPITNVTTKLRIEAGRSPVYSFSDVGFTLFGGRFTLDALRVDPRAAQVASTIHVSNLNLADVALELGISNLALEGRMSGYLPITYAPADETVTIVKGRLTSSSPGAIRYGQPGTATLRAGGDENFALALQALEDFQYTKLDLTIDKAADGKARLGIVLDGKNPDLLDGFPFNININLDTDLSQVLAALREGYRLNPDLFKGGWSFD